MQVELLTKLLGFSACGNRLSSTADSSEVAGVSLPGCTKQDFPGKYPPQVTDLLLHLFAACSAKLPGVLVLRKAG